MGPRPRQDRYAGKPVSGTGGREQAHATAGDTSHPDSPACASERAQAACPAVGITPRGASPGMHCAHHSYRLLPDTAGVPAPADGLKAGTIAPSRH
jgi:hypothetical protein